MDHNSIAKNMQLNFNKEYNKIQHQKRIPYIEYKPSKNGFYYNFCITQDFDLKFDPIVNFKIKTTSKPNAYINVEARVNDKFYKAKKPNTDDDVVNIIEKLREQKNIDNPLSNNKLYDITIPEPFVDMHNSYHINVVFNFKIINLNSIYENMLMIIDKINNDAQSYYDTHFINTHDNDYDYDREYDNDDIPTPAPAPAPVQSAPATVPVQSAPTVPVQSAPNIPIIDNASFPPLPITEAILISVPLPVPDVIEKELIPEVQLSVSQNLPVQLLQQFQDDMFYEQQQLEEERVRLEKYEEALIQAHNELYFMKIEYYRKIDILEQKMHYYDEDDITSAIEETFKNEELLENYMAANDNEYADEYTINPEFIETNIENDIQNEIEEFFEDNNIDSNANANANANINIYDNANWTEIAIDET